MNTKLHAICDSQERPLNLFITDGQVKVSDYMARELCSAAYQTSTACSGILAMMQIGSERG